MNNFRVLEKEKTESKGDNLWESAIKLPKQPEILTRSGFSDCNFFCQDNDTKNIIQAKSMNSSFNLQHRDPTTLTNQTYFAENFKVENARFISKMLECFSGIGEHIILDDELVTDDPINLNGENSPNYQNQKEPKLFLEKSCTSVCEKDSEVQIKLDSVHESLVVAQPNKKRNLSMESWELNNASHDKIDLRNFMYVPPNMEAMSLIKQNQFMNKSFFDILATKKPVPLQPTSLDSEKLTKFLILFFSDVEFEQSLCNFSETESKILASLFERKYELSFDKVFRK